MEEKQFYTAIDLGTTNSVIAYGNIVRDKMKPKVMELNRKSDTGSSSRNPLLPSVVFYYKNSEGKMVTDVGDYAKSRYGTLSGYVCKSVKSLMGVKDTVPLVDEIEDKTPADVSAQILSFMVNSAKKLLFQKELRDVVITVPASFDSDQCQATIDAARKAGINTENMHDILLYEPKAVIYDFMRMQEDGEIPSNLLCLDTDKNVLVFDLGGGTLDVTIHRVGYTEDGIINIKDIAISRYTLLGGDNFDELLAAEMLRHFEEMNMVKVSVKRREEVMCKLRKLAEQLKIDLSMAYENAQMSDMELPDDYEIDVMDINLYDSYAYEDYFTKADVERIVSPLMGKQYKISDVSRIQRMDEKDVDNIIYPILDVLDKAGKSVSIDAVILNGGMTKFYLIQKRLKDFFGFDPLTTSDPDLAVARGAVYYHYCLHKYNVRKIGIDQVKERKTIVQEKETVIPVSTKNVFHTGTILNDSINLGLRGEYVSLLIPAGTELPYRSDEIRGKYQLDKNTDMIGIEMFLGRGKTKNLPNRRIATRTVKFKNSFPAGTPISFQVYIDSMRMMTMEAWITDRPYTKSIMEMDMASLKTAEKSSKGISTTEKIRLNAKGELNNLKGLADRNKGVGHKLNEQIRSIVNAITKAANPEDFFDPCIDIVKNCAQSDVMNGYMYEIATALYGGWTDSQKRQILSLATRHFRPEARSIHQDKYVVRKAIELVSLLEPAVAEFFADYLRRNPDEGNEVRSSIFYFVVIHEKDTASLMAFLKEFARITDINVYVAKELVKRYGAGTDKTEQKKLSNFVRFLADSMKGKSNDVVYEYIPVLIAEICSGDGDNPLQEDSYTMKYVSKSIKAYMDEVVDDSYRNAIISLLNGVALTEEEEQVIRKTMQKKENEVE